MANFIAARLDGDDYQALVFWEQACRLIRELDDIESIEIESEDLKSIDDVVLYFKDGHMDKDGRLIKKEGYQVKYHVDFRDCLQAESLICPAFINATTHSFLQRAFDLWNRYGNEGLNMVFFTPWPIDPHDSLGKLVSGDDGHLFIEKLSEAGPHSKLGKTRKLWCSHLNVDNAILLRFIESIRIITSEQKGRLLEHVNNNLVLAGLRPISSTELINPYLSLSRALIQGRKNSHLTRKELLSLCKRSKLWRGTPLYIVEIKRIAIRSRLRATEEFATWSKIRLDLLDKFDDRKLKNGLNWNCDILLSLDSFLREQLKPGDCCELWMSVHASIATTIGYILDSKQGVDVRVRQTMLAGTETWKNSLPTIGDDSIGDWTINDETMENGEDIAIAISVTHNIGEDVRTYMHDSGVKVAVLRHFLHKRCGKQAVSDQEEATVLVEKVIESARQLKRAFIKRETARKCVVHLFTAMPNFMSFAIGQRLRPLGCVQLYEHDLDSGYGADYSPSLQLNQKSRRMK